MKVVRRDTICISIPILSYYVPAIYIFAFNPYHPSGKKTLDYSHLCPAEDKRYAWKQSLKQHERNRIMTALKETKPPTKELESRSSIEKFLTFQLDTESYGIGVLSVKEIIRLQTITVVPRMPDYVKGVINLRGKVIPVIDLRARFELPRKEDTESTCIIVVQIRLQNGDERLVGLVVDAVEEVLNVASTEIEQAPDFGSQLSTEYIFGMAKIKGGVKTLLNIDIVINDSNIDQITL